MKNNVIKLSDIKAVVKSLKTQGYNVISLSTAKNEISVSSDTVLNARGCPIIDFYRLSDLTLQVNSEMRVRSLSEHAIFVLAKNGHDAKKDHALSVALNLQDEFVAVNNALLNLINTYSYKIVFDLIKTMPDAVKQQTKENR